MDNQQNCGEILQPKQSRVFIGRGKGETCARTGTYKFISESVPSVEKTLEWIDLLETMPEAAAAKVLDIKLSLLRLACNNKNVPELDMLRMEALKSHAAKLAGETIKIADDPDIDAAKGKVMVQARQWLAGKEDRDRYGEKQQVDVRSINVEIEVPAAPTAQERKDMGL